MTQDSFTSNVASDRSDQLLDEDGALPPTRMDTLVDAWLPHRDQALNALQLQFEPYTEDPEPYPPDSVWFTSMRQGLGLIIVVGLVAGFLPFLVNWWRGASAGTVTPLRDLAHSAEAMPLEMVTTWGGAWQALQIAAGLPPAVFPGWLAAGLSALGLWINWPLNWLAVWIVCGAGVALVSHWLGSPVTMQRFYALTSYAVLPLAITGLGIIPCAGFLINLFAGIYALVIYIFAVRAATGLEAGRAIIATLAPLAILFILGAVLAVSLGALLAALIAMSM